MLNLASGVSSGSLVEVVRLAGLPLTQSDLPWWVTRAFSWALMVKQLEEVYGDSASANYARSRWADVKKKEQWERVFTIYREYLHLRNQE